MANPDAFKGRGCGGAAKYRITCSACIAAPDNIIADNKSITFGKTDSDAGECWSTRKRYPGHRLIDAVILNRSSACAKGNIYSVGVAGAVIDVMYVAIPDGIIIVIRTGDTGNSIRGGAG